MGKLALMTPYQLLKRAVWADRRAARFINDGKLHCANTFKMISVEAMREFESRCAESEGLLDQVIAMTCGERH